MSYIETLAIIPGEKVTYIPYEGCDPSEYQKGIIKRRSDDHNAFVVYHCGDDWENYDDYTAARTKINQLKKGWI